MSIRPSTIKVWRDKFNIVHNSLLFKVIIWLAALPQLVIPAYESIHKLFVVKNVEIEINSLQFGIPGRIDAELTIRNPTDKANSLTDIVLISTIENDPRRLYQLNYSFDFQGRLSGAPPINVASGSTHRINISTVAHPANAKVKNSEAKQQVLRIEWKNADGKTLRSMDYDIAAATGFSSFSDWRK